MKVRLPLVAMFVAVGESSALARSCVKGKSVWTNRPSGEKVRYFPYLGQKRLKE